MSLTLCKRQTDRGRDSKSQREREREREREQCVRGEEIYIEKREEEGPDKGPNDNVVSWSLLGRTGPCEIRPERQASTHREHLESKRLCERRRSRGAALRRIRQYAPGPPFICRLQKRQIERDRARRREEGREEERDADRTGRRVKHSRKLVFFLPSLLSFLLTARQR